MTEFSLDECKAKIDHLYARHTAATLEMVSALGKEVEAICAPLENAPVDVKKAAGAILTLRERQMEREITEAVA